MMVFFFRDDIVDVALMVVVVVVLVAVVMVLVMVMEISITQICIIIFFDTSETCSCSDGGICSIVVKVITATSRIFSTSVDVITSR